MNVTLLHRIVERNQPQQLQLLDRAVERLGTASGVTHLLVRGSFASGQADRSSDVDLVIGVRPDDFDAFVSVLEPLMRTEFATIFPGWPDVMVGDMGGRGFVFLAPADGVLCQLDIYVTMAPNIPAIVENGAALLIDNTVRPVAAPAAMPQNVAQSKAQTDPAEALIIEALVVFYMLSKRLMRGQSFIVYGQTYMLTDALRRLMKQVFAPQSKHWGWYNLDEDVGLRQQGRACLVALSSLTSAPLMRDRRDLQQAFDQILAIANAAAPDAVARLAPAIEAYKHYLKL